MKTWPTTTTTHEGSHVTRAQLPQEIRAKKRSQEMRITSVLICRCLEFESFGTKVDGNYFNRMAMTTTVRGDVWQNVSCVAEGNQKKHGRASEDCIEASSRRDVKQGRKNEWK